jgi:hypothetical protein
MLGSRLRKPVGYELVESLDLGPVPHPRHQHLPRRADALRKTEVRVLSADPAWTAEFSRPRRSELEARSFSWTVIAPSRGGGDPPPRLFFGVSPNRLHARTAQAGRSLGASSAATCWIVREETQLLGVAADVGIDERAQRYYPEPPFTHVVQCAGDERRAEALALQRLVDFRVEERKHVVAPIAVDEFPCVLAADQQLIPALVRPMRNDDVVIRVH